MIINDSLITFTIIIWITIIDVHLFALIIIVWISYEYIRDHIYNHHVDGQHKHNLGYPNLNHYIDHNHENQRDYIHHYHNRSPSKIST